MSDPEQVQRERVEDAPEETSPGQIRPEGAEPGAPAAGTPGADPVSASGPGDEHRSSSGHEGGRAHTPAADGHPDLGEGERSARDLGGPKAADDAEGSDGTEPGAHGDIATKGMPPH